MTTPPPQRADGGWWFPVVDSSGAAVWQWRPDPLPPRPPNPSRRRRRWPWLGALVLAAVGFVALGPDVDWPSRGGRERTDVSGIRDALGWSGRSGFEKLAVCQGFRSDPATAVDLVLAGRSLDRGEVETFLWETC